MTPEIRFRPLEERDLPRLHRWLEDPAVKAWWYPEARFGFADVVAKYRPRLEGRSPVRSFIVEVDGRAVGYIQRYPIGAYPQYAATIGAEPSWVGIDYFIGVPQARGLGLGPRMIRRFVEDVVFADPETEACVSGPDPANERSVRALEAAGFAPWRDLAPGEGGARGSERVMVRRRDRDATPTPGGAPS